MTFCHTVLYYIVYTALLFVCGGIFIFPSCGQAQTINETTPFNFGSLALRDNNAVYSLYVSRVGVVVVDAAILLITGDPVPAEYELTGFPADTQLTVYAADSVLSSGGSSESFTITDYDYVTNPVTSPAGSYTLSLGSTIKTSGTGTMYTDVMYSGTFQLTVSY